MREPYGVWSLLSTGPYFLSQHATLRAALQAARALHAAPYRVALPLFNFGRPVWIAAPPIARGKPRKPSTLPTRLKETP